MSARMTSNQLGFSLGDVTYIVSDYYDEPTPSLVSPSHELWAVRWWRRLVVNYFEWQHRRAVIQEMAMMTDRELSDIGLSRSDLARVFAPTSATNLAPGRDFIGY